MQKKSKDRLPETNTITKLFALADGTLHGFN